MTTLPRRLDALQLGADPLYGRIGEHAGVPGPPAWQDAAGANHVLDLVEGDPKAAGDLADSGDKHSFWWHATIPGTRPVPSDALCTARVGGTGPSAGILDSRREDR